VPPKLKILRDHTEELLGKVIRPIKSPRANPAFLLPKSGGEHGMVVDCKEVNLKICLGSNQQPTTEHAFQQFLGASVFTVLDLNFSESIHSPGEWVTAFYTPFGIYQFNKLPIGIGVGCQGLSRVVDHMVADLKGKCVFIFTDNLVVCSLSVSEHCQQLRQVLGGYSRRVSR